MSFGVLFQGLADRFLNLLIERRLVLLDGQDVVAPRSRICSAISFWQPIASIVTNAPEISSNWSSSGIAVISLDFSSTTT